MNENSVPIVILDACVLYPAPVRDILLSIASMRMFHPRWTDEINEEWVRNLLDKRKDLKRKQLHRTVMAMNSAFIFANVIEYEHLIPTLKLPDKNDRHVLAAAIKAEANVILTFNLRDFPNNLLKKYSIVAVSPDVFISKLIESNKNGVCQGVKNMIARLQNPPKSKEDILKTLKKCNLSKSAELIDKNC